jgi:hypothetical protein
MSDNGNTPERFIVEPSDETAVFRMVVKEHRGAGVRPLETSLAKLTGPLLRRLILEGGTLEDVIESSTIASADTASTTEFKFPDGICVYAYDSYRQDWAMVKGNHLSEQPGPIDED